MIVFSNSVSCRLAMPEIGMLPELRPNNYLHSVIQARELRSTPLNTKSSYTVVYCIETSEIGLLPELHLRRLATSS
eukprot:3729319-Pyramimonas_sp.AAC.1